MLLIVAVLLVLAIAGGIVVHPVLFLIALVALVILIGDRRAGRRP